MDYVKIYEEQENVFQNFKIDKFFIVVSIYLILVGVAYFLIFHKHHKRNKIELDELIGRISKYYVKTIFSTLILFIGIAFFASAFMYHEERSEVILAMVLGVVVTTLDIYYYIKFIKEALMDLDPDARENEKKHNEKIGDIVMFIILLLFIFVLPIYRLVILIRNYSFGIQGSSEIKNLLISIVISFMAIVVMFSMNPINWREKLKEKISAKKQEK